MTMLGKSFGISRTDLRWYDVEMVKGNIIFRRQMLMLHQAGWGKGLVYFGLGITICIRNVVTRPWAKNKSTPLLTLRLRDATLSK